MIITIIFFFTVIFVEQNLLITHLRKDTCVRTHTYIKLKHIPTHNQ